MKYAQSGFDIKRKLICTYLHNWYTETKRKNMNSNKRINVGIVGEKC